jgi:hypothetical protein
MTLVFCYDFSRICPWAFATPDVIKSALVPGVLASPPSPESRTDIEKVKIGMPCLAKIKSTQTLVK